MNKEGLYRETAKELVSLSLLEIGKKLEVLYAERTPEVRVSSVPTLTHSLYSPRDDYVKLKWGGGGKDLMKEDLALIHSWVNHEAKYLNITPSPCYSHRVTVRELLSYSGYNPEEVLRLVRWLDSISDCISEKIEEVDAESAAILEEQDTCVKILAAELLKKTKLSGRERELVNELAKLFHKTELADDIITAFGGLE